MRATAQRVNDRANESLAPLGLNAGKYNYLVALSSSKTRSRTLNEISTLIHTSSATVTGMIASLERDGLVERQHNPLDGRSTVAKLTRRGEAVLRKAVPSHHRRIEELMDGFSREERRQLFSLLLKLGIHFAPPLEPT